MTPTKTYHDLGSCEDEEGFLCEECRIEYMTMWQDYDWQDSLDERFALDNER